jgi:chromosome segregation ATPase
MSKMSSESQISMLKSSNRIISKELEELKEENSKLKNGIITEHERAELCKDKVLDLSDISKGLQKDVKKLKEELEKLKKDYEKRTKGRDKWKSVATELSDENDVIKKENDKMKYNILITEAELAFNGSGRDWMPPDKEWLESCDYSELDKQTICEAFGIESDEEESDEED